MNAIKNVYNKLRNNRLFSLSIVPLYRKTRDFSRIPKEKKTFKNGKKLLLERDGRRRVFYLGSPSHANLGDLAQGVCIRKWIGENFPEYELVEIKTNWLVNTHYSLLSVFKSNYRSNDIIIFQSGYATTDLGGHADDMHCAVIETLPNAYYLMMPQTILFESKERKKRTSEIYNSASKMLFLARDRLSFQMAKEMFPDIEIREYPDIVTTLIGNRNFQNTRNGILFCCRDDSEKFYSENDISQLMQRCSKIDRVEITDTTKYKSEKDIINHPSDYVESEIEKYSYYRLVITDRYHGTIFSLVAGTPVIIIKSTDHKVTTGADWFKGIYDDYVFLADDLNEAYEIAKLIYNKNYSHKLDAYFEKAYYDNLRELFFKTTKYLI